MSAPYLMAYTLKTAPTFEPVATDTLMEHIRFTPSDDRLLLQRFVSAARQWVEAYTGRSLATQTWQASMPSLTSPIWLPMAAPLASVTHVKYYDTDNVQQTWASSNYLTPAFHEPAMMEWSATATLPSVYDRSDAVQLEYVAGYAQDECPESLQMAVLMLAAHFFENREAVLVSAISKEVEFAVTALAAPYRVWVSGWQA